MTPPTSLLDVEAVAVATEAPSLDDQPTIVPDPPTSATGSRGRRPSPYLVGVLLVVVVAGALRALALPSALPYTSYVDEGYVLRPAAHMVADRSWDPDWYGYPSLLIELTAAGTAAYDVVGDVRTSAREVDATDDYNAVAPVALIVTARLLVWAAGVGTVIVTLLLATRLLGRRGGLVAGAIVAVVPALVSRSAITIVDTPATFFVMASMLAASTIGRGRRPVVAAAAAGALAGLAATSKYPSAAVIVVTLVVIAATTSSSWRRRAGWAATAVVAAGVAVVATMPALVLRPGAVADALRDQAAVYGRKATPTGYLQDLVGGAEVGWWLLVPAVVGIGLLLGRLRSRWLTIGWLAFVAVFAVAVSRSAFQPFRNILPVVPFLAVAGAATLVEAGRLVARTTAGSGAPRARRLALGVTGAATAVILVALVIGGVQPFLEQRAAIVDSRSQAVDYLVAQVRPGQRVLVAGELAIARSELERIPATVDVVTTTDGSGVVTADGYDFVVTGVYKGTPTPIVAPEAGDLVATFGAVKAQPLPGLWRGVNQVIEIRSGSSTP